MGGDHRHPPLLGRALLKLLQPRERRAEITGDLSELFERRLRDRGSAYASWRYCADVLSLWRCRHRAEDDESVWMAFDLRDVSDDVRFAVRMFCRQPGTVGATIAGLALAIGMGTAVFTVLNAVALRGVGVVHPASLHRVAVADLDLQRITGSTSAIRGNWAAQDYAALELTVQSLRTVAALSVAERMSFRVAGEQERSETVPVMAVSGGYFSILGGGASLGRTLSPQDDVDGAAPSAFLSHTFWKNRLAGEPAIVGRQVWLGGTPFTVVGVAARAFGGGVTPEPPAVWVTFATHAGLWRQRHLRRMRTMQAEITLLSAARNLTPLQRVRLEALRTELASAPQRWNQPVDVLGRLNPGISPEQARAEATAIAQGIAADRGQPRGRTPSVRLESADRDHSSAERLTAVTVTMAIIALLIFLACSNVANLLLANAAGRRREIGTRLALGASRARIVRQLLTESVLLGAAAGAAGLVLAGWLAPLLARALRVPPLLDVDPDLRVYVFAAGVTILAGVLAGLAPARYGRRGDLLGALQADRAAGPASLPSSRTRRVLIGAQAAGSIVLLVVAALFTRSLVQALSFELGFDPERLVSVSVGFGRGYDGPRTATYWDAALDRVKQMPDVAAASLAAIAPFGDGYAPHRLAEAGPHRYVLRNEVSADFFQAAGITLIRGRTFTPQEVRDEAPVAVISAELARAYWKDREPVGSTLDRVWGQTVAAVSTPRGLLRTPAGTRVIGVVADTITRFGSYDAPIIYLPLSSATIGAARMIVSVRGDPAPAARRIEEALLALDPGLHPSAVLVRDGVKRELELPAAVAATTGILSITAVALAAIGIFGVTAFVVGQRRHEISVRMALGATGRAIVGMLLRDGLRPVFVGMLSGLALAAIAGQVIRRVLYGVAGHDPIAIAVSVLILCTAASAAVWIPARQAARTSPAEMLKEL